MIKLIRKLLWKIQSDREFKVAKVFAKSKLDGRSMLFTNDVAMFLVRNKNNNYDAISEAISLIGDASGSLPDNSEVVVSGIQLNLKTKDMMDDKTIEKMECYGFLFQSAHESIDHNDNPIWYSTFYVQTPDFWEQEFDEFLKTYPDYLQKKYKERNLQN